MGKITPENCHAFAISKETDNFVTKTKILFEVFLPNRDGKSNFYFEISLVQIGKETTCEVVPINNIESYFGKYNISDITDYAFSKTVTQKIINVCESKLEPFLLDYYQYNDANDSYKDESDDFDQILNEMMGNSYSKKNL